MRSVGRIRRTLIATALVTLAVVATVIAGGGPAADDSAFPQLSRQTGGDLLRGIFYGEGPVAERLPEIWKQRAASGGTARADSDAVLARIQALDPGFLSTFALDVQSGNHPRVQTALREAAEMIDRVSVALATAAPVNSDFLDLSLDKSLTKIFVIALPSPPSPKPPVIDTSGLLIHTSIIAVVTDRGQLADAGSSLQRDQIVDLVTRRLVHLAGV